MVDRLMTKEILRKKYLVVAGLSLIFIGLLVSTLGQVGYISAKSQVESDYYVRKQKLENDRILGLLPEEGISSYTNQSTLLENEYRYNLARTEFTSKTNLVKIVGSGIAQIGFWAFSISIMFTVLANKELSEKVRLALLLGLFALLVFVVYISYTVLLTSLAQVATPVGYS